LAASLHWNEFPKSINEPTGYASAIAGIKLGPKIPILCGVILYRAAAGNVNKALKRILYTEKVRGVGELKNKIVLANTGVGPV
jgi:hypothetical protein